MNEVKCCIKVDNFAKLRFLSSTKSCYAVRKWPLRNIILKLKLKTLFILEGLELIRLLA